MAYGKGYPFYQKCESEYVVYEIIHLRDGYGIWRSERKCLGSTTAVSEGKAIQNVCRRLGKNPRGEDAVGRYTEYKAERCAR